ncbi:MAG: PKD domain-containing protein [Chloroflexi bacterium]|nr:PKD domain-containing protein [Chloroflexota bacterium]
MNGTLSIHRRKPANLWKLLILGMFLLIPALLLTSVESLAAPVQTPLQASGLTPLWQENFAIDSATGSIDRMQYSWFQGANTHAASFVQPGAIYLGRSGGTCPAPLTAPCEAEQQINNFKADGDSVLPQTIEFDVYSPQRGRGRVSVRPSRWGDMITLLLGIDDKGNDSGRTEVRIGQDNQCLHEAAPGNCLHNEQTGPNYNSGWTHIVISYRQYYTPTLWAQFVVAVNEEVYEINRASELVPGSYPDWQTEFNSDSAADAWSIEHSSTITDTNTGLMVAFGKYIANVRTYGNFYDATQLDTLLPGDAGFLTYLASLGNPTNFAGTKKMFQDPGDPFPVDPVAQGTLGRPHAMAFAAQVGGANSKTFAFDGTLASAWDEMSSYSWNFGDSTPAGSGRSVNHTYATGGTKTVILTVTRLGPPQTLTDTFQLTVNVPSDPPPPPPPSFSLFLPLLVK